MPSIHATLRVTTVDDLPTLFAQLYAPIGRVDGNLVLRTMEEHEASPAAYVVTVAGRPIAAGAAFAYPGLPYVELGNDAVAEPFRGFGLQRLLVETRVARCVAQHRVGRPATFVMAAKPGCRSIDNYVALGFHDCEMPDPRFAVPCSGCPDHEGALRRGVACCCQFFCLDQSSAEDLVLDFLRRPQVVVRQRRRDDATLVLRMETRLLGDPDLRTALESFARPALARRRNAQGGDAA